MFLPEYKILLCSLQVSLVDQLWLMQSVWIVQLIIFVGDGTSVKRQHAVLIPQNSSTTKKYADERNQIQSLVSSNKWWLCGLEESCAATSKVVKIRFRSSQAERRRQRLRLTAPKSQIRQKPASGRGDHEEFQARRRSIAVFLLFSRKEGRAILRDLELGL